MPVSAFDSLAYPSAGPQPTRVDPVRMVLVTAPAVEPWLVTDDELLMALKIDSDTSDAAYVTLCISAARRHFEKITGLCLINQTWKASLDRVPQGRELTLPRAPLVSVSSIKYLDDDSTEATMSANDYALGSVGAPSSFGRVRVRASADWPDAGDVPDALQITFVAGFGAAASAVPGDIRVALLHLIAHWYENRLPVSVGAAVNDMPHSLAAIIESHRVANIA